MDKKIIILLILIMIIGSFVAYYIFNKTTGSTTASTTTSSTTGSTIASAVNCLVDNWSNFGECNQTTGKRTKTRSVIIQPSNGGIQCPSLTETENCPVNCVVGNWISGECNITTGTRTKTRSIITQPLNGGTQCPSLTETENCPVNCVVGNWNFGSCDTSRNRIRTRPIITQPLNGGTACPVLTETILDNEGCFQDEICGKVITSLGISSQTDVQTKIYSQDANVKFWEGYNCNISDRPVGIPNDELCKYADDLSKSIDSTRVSEGSKRVKTLLRCPGTLLNEGEFIGAGNTSGNYFTITVNEYPYNNIINSRVRLIENIGKKIRIWYGTDGYPIGWAFSKDWVYPQEFVNNNITLENLASIKYTSALEIVDNTGIETGIGYKFLLRFTDPFPRTNDMPLNNPKESVKWITINKPSSVFMGFGADGGVSGGFLGIQTFTASITYGSGDLNSSGSSQQHIRTNKYNNYNNYARTMSINL
jgi:hypothetical protein